MLKKHVGIQNEVHQQSHLHTFYVLNRHNRAHLFQATWILVGSLILLTYYIFMAPHLQYIH